MSVGIVVVSHSLPLAEAALQLALEMIPGDKPQVALAAGTPDGGFGTDAVAVSEAIAQVDAGAGVVVLVDLGSAVLSAEMALEFLPDPDIEVQIVPAPFVEGLLAATVRAATGGDIAAVADAARAALAPKLEQLGAVEMSASAFEETADTDSFGASSFEFSDTIAAAPEVVAQAQLINPMGLHARPAGQIAQLVSGFSAQVQIVNAAGKAADALSPLAVAALATKGADTVTLQAAGADAAAAVAALKEMITAGFGEADAALVLASQQQDAVTAEAGNTVAGGDKKQSMRSSRPLGVSKGRVYGRVLRMAAPISAPQSTKILSVPERASAVVQLQAAFSAVAGGFQQQAAAATGHTAEILLATSQLAADPTLIADSAALVEQSGLQPAVAVWQVASTIAADFEQAGGALAERASDVRSIRDRVVAELTEQVLPQLPQSQQPFILVARDLTPADTAQLNPKTCLGLILGEGGPTSHTAILARGYGIAAAVNVQAFADLCDGDMALLDGDTGEVSINPDSAQACTARTEPQLLTDLPPLTGDTKLQSGEKIALLANIGGAKDVPLAVDRGAEGAGLFRTEFCFLGRNTAPTFAEQENAYGEVFAGFAEKKVVVRTLDAGSDKPLPFVTNIDEANPALGVRGWRINEQHSEILSQQLCAIAAAAKAHTAETWVMAPMIATAKEAREFALAAEAAGLREVGAKLGVMIETPAAAVNAAEIFNEVDFVSIGTNDLTQYTLAADRMLTELAHLNSAWQPAVLRLIAGVGKAAQGRPVGVCGEAAADPLLAAVLVGLGVNSLSMTASVLPVVGAKLRELSFAVCEKAAQAALAAFDAEQARAAAAAVLQRG